ncbi:MAG: hypothetical protein AAF547_07025 [Actinomycetota bacterium]
MNVSDRSHGPRHIAVVVILALLATACTAGADDGAADQTEVGASSLPAVAPDDASGADQDQTGGQDGTDTTAQSAPPLSVETPDDAAPSDDTEPAETTTTAAPTTTTRRPEPTFRFETLAPGSALPDGQTCTQRVLVDASEENRPANAGPNGTTVDLTVDIDGADPVWNDAFAPRIDGDFTGTTEQILRWGACKWGFDEDLTRARAVTESSWLMSTAGDVTEDAGLCDSIGLTAPCSQSYGLLQVKGSVHEGTYPASTQSTAFGVDYAMAWLRACYEGSFVWLEDSGIGGYQPGDEAGCVGAWFSGQWRDPSAETYLGEVMGHLETRTWEQYRP